jgi:hypothetical protein
MEIKIPSWREGFLGDLKDLVTCATGHEYGVETITGIFDQGEAVRITYDYYGKGWTRRSAEYVYPGSFSRLLIEILHP